MSRFDVTMYIVSIFYVIVNVLYRNDVEVEQDEVVGWELSMEQAQVWVIPLYL